MDVTRYGQESYLAEIPSHYPTQPIVSVKKPESDIIYEYDEFDSLLDDGDHF
jgi:hypothetical protein